MLLTLATLVDQVTFTYAFYLTIALPGITLIAGLIILGIQLRRRLHPQTPPPVKRFMPARLWVFLGLLLSLPGTLILLFLCSRFVDRSAALTAPPFSPAVNAYVESRMFREDYTAVDGLSDGQLNRVKRNVLSYVPNPYLATDPHRNSVLKYLKSPEVWSSWSGPFFCETATLTAAPKTHFARLVPTPRLDQALFDLPLSDSDLRILSYFHRCSLMHINVPADVTPQVRAQFHRLLQWSQELDTLPITFVNFKGQPDISLLEALTPHPRISGVSIIDLTDPSSLTVLARCPVLVNLELTFAAPASDARPSTLDLTGCAKLYGLRIKNLPANIQGPVADTGSLKSLQMDNVPCFPLQFLSSLSRPCVKLSIALFTNVNLDPTPASFWQNFDSDVLSLNGDIPDHVLQGLALNTKANNIVLTIANRPFTLALAQKVHLIPRPLRLGVLNPDPQALELLDTSPTLTGINLTSPASPDITAKVKTLNDKCMRR